MDQFELFYQKALKEDEAYRKWFDSNVKKSPEQIKKDAAKEIFTDFDKDYVAKRDAEADVPRKPPLAGPDGGPGEVTRKGGEGMSPVSGTGLKDKEQPFVGQYPNSPLKTFDSPDDLSAGDDISGNKYFQDVIKDQESIVEAIKDEVQGEIGRIPEDEDDDDYYDLIDAWEERLDNFAAEYGNDSSTAGFGISGVKLREMFDNDFTKNVPNIIKLFRDYSRNGSFNLNRFLRFGETGDYDEDTLKEVVKYITDIGRFNQGYGDVYRGDWKNRLKSLQVGDIIRDPAFMSTSFDKSAAEDLFGGYEGQLMKISGASGHELTDKETFLTNGEEESELILPPNQLLRFMGFRDDTYNFDALDRSDYDDTEWGRIMKRQDEDGYDLGESRLGGRLKRRITQAFKKRMSDFEFEVINPATKKFEEFNFYNK